MHQETERSKAVEGGAPAESGAPQVRYEFVRGFCPRTDVSAAEAYGALVRLAVGGVLTPAAVVAGLKSARHPLHGELTWDDGEAARQQREAEAARLLRSVIVIRMDKGIEQPPVRALVRVTEQAEGAEARRVYLDPEAALADPKRRAELRRLVVEELRSWVERSAWHADRGLVSSAARDRVEAALRDL